MLRPTRERQAGQILVLFVIALVAMFSMLGLLLDGGHALAIRRQYQDAGDAAALSAANGLVQSGASAGCSATAGPPPGSPRASVIAAARTAVHASLPNVPDANIVVTCPGGWGGNFTVQVDVNGRSPGYFGGVVGMNGFAIGTTSQAINGSVASIKYSVVELDPYNSTWPNGYTGCPSVLFSGSNTVIFDGAVQVDSACPAGSGGALSSNGSSANIQVNNGATISLVGGYTPGALTISPTPLTGQASLKDPLSWLPAVPYSGITAVAGQVTVAGSQTTLSGGSTVLYPGVYTGGIKMKNSAIAYMRPGIYVMKDAANGDGGFQMGAGNKVYTIPASLSSTTDATWATDCTTTNCGILIYTVGQACASGSPKDQISVGAGATLKLRPYLPTADGTGINESSYENLLLWQDATPTPTASCYQPPLSLSGGGQISLSGTLYTPSAAVQMGGNSGGAGGSTVDVTLQFISWDLSFNGNIGFHFFYQSDSFARPKDYGLIK
jgi:Flp pilus assembly protein TadG